MTDDMPILDETYHRLGDAPVMICLLTLPGPPYWVGVSSSTKDRFNEGVARVVARANAVRACSRVIAGHRLKGASHGRPRHP